MDTAKILSLTFDRLTIGTDLDGHTSRAQTNQPVSNQIQQNGQNGHQYQQQQTNKYHPSSPARNGPVRNGPSMMPKRPDVQRQYSPQPPNHEIDKISSSSSNHSSQSNGSHTSQSFEYFLEVFFSKLPIFQNFGEIDFYRG